MLNLNWNLFSLYLIILVSHVRVLTVYFCLGSSISLDCRIHASCKSWNPYIRLITWFSKLLIELFPPMFILFWTNLYTRAHILAWFFVFPIFRYLFFSGNKKSRCGCELESRFFRSILLVFVTYLQWYPLCSFVFFQGNFI